MGSRARRILELGLAITKTAEGPSDAPPPRPSSAPDDNEINTTSIISAPIIIENVEYPADYANSNLFDDIPNMSFSFQSFELDSSVLNNTSTINELLELETCDPAEVGLVGNIENDLQVEMETYVPEEVVGNIENDLQMEMETYVPEEVVGNIENDLQVEMETYVPEEVVGNIENDVHVEIETYVPEEVVGNIENNLQVEMERYVPEEVVGNVENDLQVRSKKVGKRSQTKALRMLGKPYVGFKRENCKIIHDVKRDPRMQKPTCNSNKCKISKNRFCDSFSEDQRKDIFKQFWKCTWDEKKTYVINMVNKIFKKRETAGMDESRRNFTLEYHLKYSNNDKKQVCKAMFLGTLGLNEWMVKNWVDKSDHGLPHKVYEREFLEEGDGPNGGLENIKEKSNRSSSKKNHLREWINSLHKLESHYCRKDSKRLYLEGPFNSKQEVYDLYLSKCKDDKVVPFKRTSVMKVFEENKISIFKPRKDLCDLCISYKMKQITEEEYSKHIYDKNRAREEKESDKKNAQEGKSIVFTMDLQSVNLCPKTNSSALYYSMKLKVYNLTIFNIGTGKCSTYWWNECEGELEASVFASIVLQHLKTHCLPLPEGCTGIVLYSDGCGYQNRNHILSNALLNFSIEFGLTIEQKYLVKGHSQMECDSAHALIERRIKNRDIYLPSDYVKTAKECKKTKPFYDAVLLDHTYFHDYSAKDTLVYKSIRPGKSVGDPAVKDVRALKYDPTKKMIKFKLCFTENYKELPQRQNKTNFTTQARYKLLYPKQIPLTLSKYEDLQKLKHVLPPDTHFFYDSLPHASKFVNRQKEI